MALFRRSTTAFAIGACSYCGSAYCQFKARCIHTGKLMAQLQERDDDVETTQMEGPPVDKMIRGGSTVTKRHGGAA